MLFEPGYRTSNNTTEEKRAKKAKKEKKKNQQGNKNNTCRDLVGKPGKTRARNAIRKHTHTKKKNTCWKLFGGLLVDKEESLCGKINLKSQPKLDSMISFDGNQCMDSPLAIAHVCLRPADWN